MVKSDFVKLFMPLIRPHSLLVSEWTESTGGQLGESDEVGVGKPASPLPHTTSSPSPRGALLNIPYVGHWKTAGDESVSPNNISSHFWVTLG